MWKRWCKKNFTKSFDHHCVQVGFKVVVYKVHLVTKKHDHELCNDFIRPIAFEPRRRIFHEMNIKYFVIHPLPLEDTGCPNISSQGSKAELGYDKNYILLQLLGFTQLSFGILARRVAKTWSLIFYSLANLDVCKYSSNVLICHIWFSYSIQGSSIFQNWLHKEREKNVYFKTFFDLSNNSSNAYFWRTSWFYIDRGHY